MSNPTRIRECGKNYIKRGTKNISFDKSCKLPPENSDELKILVNNHILLMKKVRGLLRRLKTVTDREKFMQTKYRDVLYALINNEKISNESVLTDIQREYGKEVADKVRDVAVLQIMKQVEETGEIPPAPPMLMDLPPPLPEPTKVVLESKERQDLLESIRKGLPLRRVDAPPPKDLSKETLQSLQDVLKERFKTMRPQVALARKPKQSNELGELFTFYGY